jgi:hypothetical protein
MSLINDALKRARESQRNQPPGAPPLPPVESSTRGGAGWILTAAAILFLAAVGLLLGPIWFGHKSPPAGVAKTTAIPAPPPVAAAPVRVANTAPSATNTTPPAVTNTNPPPPVVAVEQLPKVQGIIFNAAHPLAIVNGQTVNVGDRVGNYQVKQITQNNVVFQRLDGSQKTLGIGD